MKAAAAVEEASMEGMDKRQQGEELSNLIFLLRSDEYGCGLDVYGLHTDSGGGSGLVLKRLFNCNPSLPLTTESVVASDSKLCVVGGNHYDSETNKFPQDFLMWDLTNWRNKEEGDFKCDRGPYTLEAKPYPCLFSVGEDVYALAGLNCRYQGIGYGIPDPLFEYYDSRNDCWNGLPPPPFNSYYGDSTCIRTIQHKLVGKILYVAVGCYDVYSYHVDNRKWATVVQSDGQVVGGDFAVNNMVTYCNWNRICNDEIDGDMTMFRCADSIDMFACDLKANAKITDDADVEMLDKSDSVDKCSTSPLPADDDDDNRSLSDFEILSVSPSHICTDSESSESVWSLPDVEVTYPYFPVTGLEEITRQVDRERYSTSGFVAHLAGNIFCAVYFYPKRDSYRRHVLACKFEVTKHSGAADDIPDSSKSKFQANILSSIDIGIYCKWSIFQSQWFKIRV